MVQLKLCIFTFGIIATCSRQEPERGKMSIKGLRPNQRMVNLKSDLQGIFIKKSNGESRVCHQISSRPGYVFRVLNLLGSMARLAVTFLDTRKTIDLELL